MERLPHKQLKSTKNEKNFFEARGTRSTIFPFARWKQSLKGG